MNPLWWGVLGAVNTVALFRAFRPRFCRLLWEEFGPKPRTRVSHSSRADGGSNRRYEPQAHQASALLGDAATSPHPPLHPSGGGAATPQAA